jgi:invasion protein IalB
MQIADKDYKVAPFETCLPNVGCSASFVVEGELEAALKASKLLKITYKTIDGQLVSLDVKTEGYTKAIAKF